MLDRAAHEASVDRWLEAAPIENGPLACRFEAVLTGVWRAAHPTLGGITLTAIFDRVLHEAREKYPALAGVRLEPPQVRFEVEAGAEDLREGVRFTLLALLTLIGRLTAEILSPALHGALSRMIEQDVDHSPSAPSPGEDGGKNP